VNTYREMHLVSCRGHRLAAVFSPQVAPDPIVERQLEDRVKAVLEEMLERKRAADADGQELYSSSNVLRFSERVGRY
jgi:hypothetical protein